MRANKLAVLSTLTLALVSAQTGEITVNTTTRFMIDGSRRPVLLHGVNVVYKVPPYVPTIGDAPFDAVISLNDQDIEDMVKWGFNFVRLGVMWEAVETAPGVYNQTYLNEVNTLINKLGARGIYTMVDAHQDVFARTICGEGMPTFYIGEGVIDHVCHGEDLPWAIHLYGKCQSMNDFNFIKDQNGYPLISECNKNSFVRYYQTAESLSAFEMLYKNTNGLQDKFVAFWDKVSSFFANNQYVIGYDPINEPYPSNYNVDPSIAMVPGKFNKDLLQPMYARIYDIYRKYSSKKMMYFEPGQFPDTVGVDGGKIFPLGFTQPPGGYDNLTTQVLNDHSYCCQKDPTMCATGEPPLSRAQECLGWHKLRIGTRFNDSQRYQVPLIISEFGACTASEACAQEITSTTETCDQYLVGWAYWEFKKFKDLTTTAGQSSEGVYEDDGTLQLNKIKALARTYVKAYQGTPLYMRFNPDNGVFTTLFQYDSTITDPSVVFRSTEYFYPKGYKLLIFNEDGISLTNEQYTVKGRTNYVNDIEITITDKGLHDQNIEITIIPN